MKKYILVVILFIAIINNAYSQNYLKEHYVNQLKTSNYFKHSEITTFTRQMKFFTSNDTLTKNYKVFRLKYSKSNSLYKIIRNNDSIIYLKDSSGFYIYTQSNQVLASCKEPSNILGSNTFIFYNSENLDQLLDSNYFFSVDSTTKDSIIIYNFNYIEVGKLGELINIKIYQNKKDRTIFRVEDVIWLDSLVQYRNDQICSFQFDVSEIYDSIKLDNQNFIIRKSIDGDEFLQNQIKSVENLKGLKAPNFQLVTLNYDSIELYSIDAEIYILDFHFKGCHPCWLMHEKLNKIREQFPSNKLEILAINPIDRIDSSLVKFYEMKQVKYSVYLVSKNLTNLYDINSYPSIFILDKNFKILDSWSGYNEGKINELEILLDLKFNSK